MMAIPELASLSGDDFVLVGGGAGGGGGGAGNVAASAPNTLALVAIGLVIFRIRHRLLYRFVEQPCTYRIAFGPCGGSTIGICR